MSSAAPLNPLDLKQPYVCVIPDWRIHVATATRVREEKQDIVKTQEP